MFNFGRTTFAMLIPVQSDEMLEAMGKALIKLGAKQVSYASETLVDKEGKPVYDCLAAIVENMPKISATTFLAKHHKTLSKFDTYNYNGKNLKLFF